MVGIVNLGWGTMLWFLILCTMLAVLLLCVIPAILYIKEYLLHCEGYAVVLLI